MFNIQSNSFVEDRYNIKEKREYTNATKNFNSIVGRLRTVSWDNSSHQTGVVKPVKRDPNPPTHHNRCVIEDNNIMNMQVLF